MQTPDFTPREMTLDLGYVNRLLGVDLTGSEIKKLLGKMRFGAEASGDSIKVSIPSYRADILHPIDLVEDVAIAYGYMNFKPEAPRLYQLGKADEVEVRCERFRDILVGLGYLEVMSLILTNPQDLYGRMNVEVQPSVEAVKPVSAEQSVARTWVLPSLMSVLEKNRNREYPQKLFEVGQAITADGRTSFKAAGVIAHSKTNYSEIKASVAGLAKNAKIQISDTPYAHDSFIKGRCSGDMNCFFGELSPQVLENFGLEVPAAAFELTVC